MLKNLKLCQYLMYCKYLGIVVIIYHAQAASFFGTQWIHKSDKGLSINADNIPVASLLNEWCEVCAQQCVVDHELKAKLSVHLDERSCDEVKTVLSENVWVDKEKALLLFRKQPKGDWVAYTCQKRVASDVAAKLKQVLLPAGKYEHIMADDVSSQVWIPKAFYEKHASMISLLDIGSPAYIVHISWVRLNARALKAYSMSEKGKNL